jgi:chromosome segregation ATPase
MTKDTKSDAAVAVSSANIREQLLATEKLIRALKQDLDYYRSQNDELIEERGDLLKTLSRLDALKGERSDRENDLSFMKSERDQLAVALRGLEETNQELEHRCLVLETALAAERKKHQEAQDVIVCLEEQIVQLESIVELFRENEELRKAEERLAAYRREHGGD